MMNNVSCWSLPSSIYPFLWWQNNESQPILYLMGSNWSNSCQSNQCDSHRICSCSSRWSSNKPLVTFGLVFNKISLNNRLLMLLIFASNFSPAINLFLNIFNMPKILLQGQCEGDLYPIKSNTATIQPKTGPFSALSASSVSGDLWLGHPSFITFINY